LRQGLDEALALDPEPDRRRAMEEVSAASPVTRLRAALAASLTPDRMTALATDVAAVLRTHRVNDLLHALTRDELDGVASALGVAPEPEEILVTLGLYSGGAAGAMTETARRLAEKAANDDFDVFLAHNSADKEAVLEIAERLREAGIHPWVDVEQVPPGAFFQDAIQKVVPRVKAAAVILGRSGIGQWQALELRSFISQCIERAMPVIPVLLPHVEAIPAEVPFLREFNPVRFGSALSDDAALRGLVWGITGRRPDPIRTL
jgi:nucleotide-binding universal stress UspA family protein